MGLGSCRFRLRLMGCPLVDWGVAESIADEDAGLGASMVCEPDGERRGSASDTGFTSAAISMLAVGRGSYLCSLHCFVVREGKMPSRRPLWLQPATSRSPK